MVRRSLGQAHGDDAGAAWQRGALAAAVVVLAIGLGAWAMGRRSAPLPQPLPSSANGRSAPSPVSPTALTAPPSTPAGELAWIPEARGPTLAALDEDGVEDVFGFFRVWDGRSAWTTFAGAFRGSTLAPMWRTEPLDPWLVRKSGIVPAAIALGKRLVVADGTDTVRVYKLSGEKEATYRIGQAPRDLCGLVEGSRARVWIDADAPATLDLDSGKLEAAPAPPATCKRPARPAPGAAGGGDAGRDAHAAWATACEGYFENRFGRAACLPPSQVPPLADVDVRYAVTDGAVAIAVATTRGNGGRQVPAAVAYGAGGKVLWQRALAADPSTLATESAPRVAELGNGRLYVVYGKAYFDGRLEALDAKTGGTAWDVPLVGSLPRPDAFANRGDAVSLVVSEARVYVARAGGGLDVFDAKTGAPVGTIGNASSGSR